MTEDRNKQDIPSVAEWRADFMRAAAASSSSSKRRWSRPLLASVVGLALIGSGGVAVAALSGSDDPSPLEEGGTVGYLDLSSGEPILCPDGEPLTYSPASFPATDLDATCSDGSVPDVFRTQRDALEAWLLSQPPQTSLQEAPTFSYSISGDE